jgi:hypothetical protein
MIVLDRCHDLAVHHDIKTGVVVLEYASEGRVVPTGAPYTNRYISVLTITDRKVTHWRDYLDPVAVFDALGCSPDERSDIREQAPVGRPTDRFARAGYEP